MTAAADVEFERYFADVANAAAASDYCLFSILARVKRLRADGNNVPYCLTLLGEGKRTFSVCPGEGDVYIIYKISGSQPISVQHLIFSHEEPWNELFYASPQHSSISPDLAKN